jgi:hypothetical protein
MTFFGRADPLSIQRQSAKNRANKHAVKQDPEPRADRGIDRAGRNPVQTQYVSTAPVTLSTLKWLEDWKRRERV